MSDSEIALLGIALSFVAAVLIWYAVEDEIERLWHENELKKHRKKRGE